MQLWNEIGNRVLMYDTKHGTNKFGLNLGCFTTIDSAGKSRVLAATFLYESEESFDWAFKKFSFFLEVTHWFYLQMELSPWPTR